MIVSIPDLFLLSSLYTVLLFCRVHKVVCFNSAFLDDDN